MHSVVCRLILTFIALGAIGSGPISAAPALQKANPGDGERLAQQWCASCHIVSPQQRQATEGALDFATIAKTPNFDAAQLALFLLDPHPVMPNMSLTRKEAADLAAYIALQAK